jgi:hypothetical protein
METRQPLSQRGRPPKSDFRIQGQRIAEAQILAGYYASFVLGPWASLSQNRRELGIPLSCLFGIADGKVTDSGLIFARQYTSDNPNRLETALSQDRVARPLAMKVCDDRQQLGTQKR